MENTLELDLEKIERLGKIRGNENLRFKTYLKQKSDEKIDNIVHQLNREISDQIDCTACGNCCKKLKPSITFKDLEDLSQKLDITTEQIKNNYTETNEGELFFKILPCSFLKDNKCTVYENRPEDCKSFPHIHKKYFTSRLWGVMDNYSICPIVFNIVEKLKIILHYR